MVDYKKLRFLILGALPINAKNFSKIDLDYDSLTIAADFLENCGEALKAAGLRDFVQKNVLIFKYATTFCFNSIFERRFYCKLKALADGEANLFFNNFEDLIWAYCLVYEDEQNLNMLSRYK